MRRLWQRMVFAFGKRGDSTVTQIDAITFRPLLPQDDNFNCKVYVSTRAEEMNLVDWSPEQKEAFLQMQFHAQTTHYRAYYPHAEYQVIQQGATPIGRLIVDRSQDPLLLMDIALLPEYRNAGIGAALILGLMEEAAGRGWSVRLHVDAFNPAMRLYERLGFVKVMEQGIYQEMIWHSRSDLNPDQNHI
jgi:ribosomal protein S18 acetylase RimI-like enzyme